MSRVIVVLLSLVAFYANGQQFEGTIKWAIKSEYPDSTQVRKAKEPRKDKTILPPDSIQIAVQPDTVVTILDDSTRVIMATGPKSKPQHQQNHQRPGMLTGISMKVKNGNILLQPDGGANAEMLYVKSSRQWYSIEHKRKAVAAIREHEGNKNKTASESAEFLKTSEVTKILGFNCVKYSKTYTTQKGRVITQEMWITDEIKNLDLSSLAKQRLGKYRFPVDKVKGVPLKLIQLSNEGKFIVEATSIKKESVSDKLVSLPADYKEIKR